MRGAFVASYQRSATHVDMILKGAKPVDLPVERVTKLDLAINLKTAQAPGVTISPSVLAQVTEIHPVGVYLWAEIASASLNAIRV